jgi:t-SNARE complex subunit (syntaxin)
MSRNRLSELQSPPTTNPNGATQQPQTDYDLERNEPIGGERYELQDRSTTGHLDLGEFLDEVLQPKRRTNEQINDVKEATGRLDAQINRIEQLHSQSLASADFERRGHSEVDSLVVSTSGLINTIKANLEKLGGDARNGGVDAKKKVDLVNAQRTRLQERVSKFQNIEKVYRDKLRDRAIRQYEIGNFLVEG